MRYFFKCLIVGLLVCILVGIILRTKSNQGGLFGIYDKTVEAIRSARKVDEKKENKGPNFEELERQLENSADSG